MQELKGIKLITISLLTPKSSPTDREGFLVIGVIINNLIAGIFLGISFLSGPSEQTPYWKILLGLYAYVLIIASISSIVTLFLFSRFKELQGVSRWRIFIAQLLFYVIGYAIALVWVYNIQPLFRV